jgi:hypothetical protein
MIPVVIGIGIVSVVGYLIFFKSPRQSDCFNGKSQALLSEKGELLQKKVEVLLKM